MKIKRVEIVGFKSFVDKVSLDFQQGITGVVGPNGCGKSNIIDAVRWAMGEQNARHLRGRAMEDIIFGGSESRKPLGLAEVSIIFDNRAGLSPPAYREYAEIMVTRRLYRNGDSEYRLNKTPCRLLDITELFMDTGVGARAYSIIEQGKVGMLVSVKPEERRSIIEEAAGVTKFKARKKTALRKMEATKQNLLRLGDIISEVRRQLGSLKRQAQRAEKFREFRGEAKRIEILLAANRFRELNQELAIVAAEDGSRSEELARFDARLEEGELQLEERQLTLATVEEELTRSQEQVYHLSSEVQRVEGELTLATRQRENLVRQDEQLQTEQQEVADRLGGLEREEELLRAAEQELHGALELAEQQAGEYEAQLQQRQQAERLLGEQLESSRRELMELLGEVSRLGNRQEEIDRRLQAEEENQQRNRSEAVALREQQEESAAQQQELSDRLRQLQQRQQELVAEREQQQEQLQLLKQRLQDAESEVSETRQQLERYRSRLESLQELELNLDGYTEGVRVLFAEQEQRRRVVADLLQVDAEHEVAVEMALGERLQAVPLRQAEEVANHIELLRQREARATFVLPDRQAAAVEPGQGQPLAELVRAKTGQEQLVAGLLAGCLLVDDLAPYYRQSLPPGTLLVTADGSCMSWRGEVSGGAPTVAGAGLLRKKREIKELRSLVAESGQVLAARQGAAVRLQDEIVGGEEELQVLSSEQHRLELQAVELEKDRDRFVQEQERLQERLELLSFEEEQLHEERQRLQEERNEIGQNRQQSGARQEELQQRTETLQAELNQARQQLEQVRERLTELRVSLAGLRERREGGQDALQRLLQNRQELHGRAALLKARREEGAEEQQRLLAGDERLRTELELLLDRREEQQAASKSVRERFEQGRQELDELRDMQRGVRSQAEELRKVVAKLQLHHRELSIDAEHVRQAALEKFRVDLAEHQVPEATEDELERQQRQLRQLQQRIEALGEVNLTAIEEYRELEERYDFLTTQRDDLHQSLEDLQKAINKINRTTRHRFKETFDQVNEKFRQVFPRLFRGGRAELKLTDENDLLQTGIEIVVQPPGKRLQNVNLLSGGEKALTAVALIFSLFLIKPTPFCVLDEVDAPLDDANIDRFAEMVREMSQASQFIIITHSKRTMTIAETMYGVTMQEPGVSKLVSVRMNDFQPREEAPLAAAQ